MSRRHDNDDYKHGSHKLKERSRSRSPSRRDDKYEKLDLKKEIKNESEDTLKNIKSDGDIKKEKEDQKTVENVGLAAKNRLKSMSIQMKLGGVKKEKQAAKPKLTVAAAFNQDSDSEPEEMPPEARMRMRNIGRDTPTSSGPNSFGKTKQGFSDAKKMFEKNLRDAMESAIADD